jgi:hypothetical protein
VGRLTGTGWWRPDALLREAGSNLSARRGRYSVLAVLVAVLVGGLVWADMSAARAAIEGKRELLAAGGTVVIAAREQGGLDAARCVELGSQGHVVAAGGLARGETVYFDHAPGTPFQSLLVTGDLVTVLDPGTRTPTAPGLVVPAAAAEELGVVAGSWLSLAGTPHRVVALVRPDPRAESVSRSILLAAPPTGQVDQCWVEFADGQYEAGAEALAAWFAADGLTLTPLIGRNVATRDYAADWSGRPLRHGWVAAGVLIGALAGLLVWRRRAEMALYVLLGSSRVVVATLQTVELWWILVAGGLLGTLWGTAIASVAGPAGTEAVAHGLRAGALTTIAGLAAVPLLAAWLIRADLATLLKERPG